MTATEAPGLLPVRMMAACLGAPAANPQHRPEAHGVPPVLLTDRAMAACRSPARGTAARPRGGSCPAVPSRPAATDQYATSEIPT
ncbi:hypothetical protein [Streptomyces sp. NPDC045251]|uniref:hypothetical protein n=1 Tax=unclassified Streptomyces TaxID=2593676 RepID=UPI0033DCC701